MRYFKKALFGLICVLSSITAMALSSNGAITITSLTLSPVMPGDVVNWAAIPGGPSLTAQAIGSLTPLRSRLVLQIKQGGVLVCGNTAATAPLTDAFRVKVFTVGDFALALSTCTRLSPGTYTLCARFFDEAGGAVSEEVCQEFLVEDAPASTPSYSPPKNLSPADNKIFTEVEMRLPVVFSWTGVTPAFNGPVIYRLKIWQISDGQTAAQAMAQNEPVVSKDIQNATQIGLNDFLTPPCKAPVLCKFVWDVQALSSQAVPIGSNNGTSQPTTAALSAAQYIIRIDSMKIACTATAGVYSFSYYITNPNPGTAKLTNFVVTSSVPAGATITSFSPPLNSTVVSGSQMIITGFISAAPSLSNICVGAELTDFVNTFNKASRDTCIPVRPCRCDACDDSKLTISTVPAAAIVINGNNTLSLNQPITITTTPAKLIKSIKAELVYFEFVPQSEECLPCNKDSKTYGNIVSGTLAAITGLGGGTHSLIWNYSPPISLAGGGTASIIITIPPTVKCCSADIRWCIRYVITFSDCTVCNKLVCYEKKKDGCSTTTNPNNN